MAIETRYNAGWPGSRLVDDSMFCLYLCNVAETIILSWSHSAKRTSMRLSLSRWLPARLTPLPRLSYLRLQYLSVSFSLSLSRQFLLSTCTLRSSQRTTLTVPLGRTLGAKERGVMVQRSSRVLYHSLHLSLFLHQKWEGKETVNGRQRKRNKKNASAEGR